MSMRGRGTRASKCEFIDQSGSLTLVQINITRQQKQQSVSESVIEPVGAMAKLASFVSNRCLQLGGQGGGGAAITITPGELRA